MTDPKKRSLARVGARNRAGNNLNCSPYNNTIDFHSINQTAVPALPAILARLLPGGKNCGGEYVVRNPTRADHRRGSFKINLRSGRWSDFAAGDKGGDPISLAAYVEGVSPLERGADLRPFLERYGALAADFIKALGVGKVLPALHAIDGERP